MRKGSRESANASKSAFALFIWVLFSVQAISFAETMPCCTREGDSFLANCNDCAGEHMYVGVCTNTQKGFNTSILCPFASFLYIGTASSRISILLRDFRRELST